MIQFQATAVEVYSEDGILTIHFDDQNELYLQIQAAEADDSDEHEQGYGSVYVEVNDQLQSGFNCFSLAELTRNSFRIVFARDPDMVGLEEVAVAFDLDEAAFGELRHGLELAFRAFAGFRALP